MKKCPSCGSIGNDDEARCGVCGADLWKVQPMTQTLEQSEIEDASKRAAEDALLNDQIRKRATLRFLVTVSIPIAVIVSGSVLLFLGFLWGIFLIAVGLLSASWAVVGLGLSSRLPPITRRELLQNWKLMKEEQERVAREQAAEED